MTSMGMYSGPMKALRSGRKSTGMPLIITLTSRVLARSPPLTPRTEQGRQQVIVEHVQAGHVGQGLGHRAQAPAGDGLAIDDHHRAERQRPLLGLAAARGGHREQLFEIEGLDVGRQGRARTLGRARHHAAEGRASQHEGASDERASPHWRARSGQGLSQTRYFWAGMRPCCAHFM